MRTKRKFQCVAIAAIAFMIAMPHAALANNFQPRGHIQNDQGQRCTYTQTTDNDSVHFHGTLPGRMGILTFDDPRCMSVSDVNKMRINHVITRWYSHPDAAFKTRVQDLYPTSMMQKRGVCIQSGKYPIIGVTIDYEIQGNSIVRVRHGNSIQGCQR
jgi:hypothetical protein